MRRPAEWYELGNGYLACYPDEDLHEEARRIRAERDAQWNNAFDYEPSDGLDLRYIGHIAEPALVDLFTAHGYHAKKRGGRAEEDVLLEGWPLEVKNRTSRTPWRPFYEVKVPQRRPGRSGAYLFTAYELAENRLLFLGGMARGKYAAWARLIREGERLYGNVICRDPVLVLPANQIDTPAEMLIHRAALWAEETALETLQYEMAA